MRENATTMKCRAPTSTSPLAAAGFSEKMQPPAQLR